MTKSTALMMVGGAGIVLLSFFGTLFALDSYSPAHILNQTRINNVTLIRGALDRFYRERRAYPALPGNPIEDLGKDLVQGGYLKQIPAPTEGFQFQYVSDGVKVYGLLVKLQEENHLLTKRPGGLCVVGIGIKGSGAWGDPPECQF
jgi:hypothetical protein